ncbi:MAG: hypothetical protein H6R19_2621 [Proteobacteria bacterium]|nr:hypothetical protein [Pseudomonadota bacterium]
MQRTHRRMVIAVDVGHTQYHTPGASFQPEVAEHLGDLAPGLRNVADGLRRGRGCHGILFANLGDVLDLLGDFAAGYLLLADRTGNFGDCTRRRHRAALDLLDGISGALRTCHTLIHRHLGGIHAAHGKTRTALHTLKQTADLAGRVCRAFGELANLIGNHRETTPLFSRTRSLDGRIERQQIGLLGNLADHVGHHRNAVAIFTQGLDPGGRFADTLGHHLDAIDGIADILGTACCHVTRGLGMTACLLRLLGHQTDPDGNLFHRGGHVRGGITLQLRVACDLA